MDALISLAEATRLLGLTTGRVYQLVQAGKLHRAKIAGTWVYFRPEVDALVAARDERRRAREAAPA